MRDHHGFGRGGNGGDRRQLCETEKRERERPTLRLAALQYATAVTSCRLQR
uniref:Uncharacterized protein n=1 Tax=Nelumbo nucifera TaxID=4432 RepID=A0A822Y0E2_NELNU|nr:TPA_asm: hypothetical protein HUJ06_027230 [Nelumbo nucifera]